MSERKTVMISSTALDLPEHRQQVMEACLRQSMQPLMMENLPAEDSIAVETSLRMVDEADIYLGIFAFRYGYVPKGYSISITEMEYNYAIERDIPRLIFIVDEDKHSVKRKDVETGPGEFKLKSLKERLTSENIVNYYESSVDLRANVIHALSLLRDRDTKITERIRVIPKPPDPYIVHPYTLLQTHDLVGREDEIRLLSNWIEGADNVEMLYKDKSEQRSDTFPLSDIKVFNIIALGGMGKSALAWKWFSEIATYSTQPMAGCMWWSFYEKGASFENFVIHALAYVRDITHEEAKSIPPFDREAQLLQALDVGRYLIVLDGLERSLIAYDSMDVAYLQDENIDESIESDFDEEIGYKLRNHKKHSLQHRLRKTINPRAGSFLKKLAERKLSRVLITSRLYPVALEDVSGDFYPGSFALFLDGLSDTDALDLWYSFGADGDRDELLQLFQLFNKHPLLIQVLVSMVSSYRRAPGDFILWKLAHPNFDPFKLPLVQVKTHILEIALSGLTYKNKQVLLTIAGFHMPVEYETINALLVGPKKLLKNDYTLDITLGELEDRGLMGWNKDANSYDMHPVVRGVVWGILDKQTKFGICSQINDYFEVFPFESLSNINSLEELAPSINKFYALVGLEQYKAAFDWFYSHLEDPATKSLGATMRCITWIKKLFPNGIDYQNNNEWPNWRWVACNELANAYSMCGQPSQAIPLYASYVLKTEFSLQKVIGFGNLSFALFLTGAMRSAEKASFHAIGEIRVTEMQYVRFGKEKLILGIILSTCGNFHKAKITLCRSLVECKSSDHDISFISWIYFSLGEMFQRNRNLQLAEQYATRSLMLALKEKFSRGIVRAERLHGQITLHLGESDVAFEHFGRAINIARTIDFLEEEIKVLTLMSEGHRLRQDPRKAHELLDEIWDSAERGPYPLLQADAFNVLAQIERDEGHSEAAIEAATKAYELAWCDGPPYAYHWGLEKAKAHLREMGAPEPDLPPFDESKFEPMPEVKINPKDEYWVDPDRLDELLQELLEDDD